MKTIHCLSIPVISLLLAACSSNPPTPALVEAHERFNVANSRPEVTNLAPLELKDAEDTLKKRIPLTKKMMMTSRLLIIYLIWPVSRLVLPRKPPNAKRLKPLSPMPKPIAIKSNWTPELQKRTLPSIKLATMPP